MKKLIIATLLFSASLAFAVTQPNSIGLVTAIIENKTVAQVATFVPKSTGQILYCSDCTLVRICTSSGTAAGAWVVSVATGVFTAASYPHCQ